MAVTEAAISAKDKALAAVATAAERATTTMIREKMDAALAHATKALTDTLKRTPDGRKTIRKASQSPSYQAALTRLAELHSSLSGISRNSSLGLIRDVRRTLYETSYSHWAGMLPAEMIQAKPSQARIKASGGIVLHGMELWDELKAPIDRSGRNLLAALTAAGKRSTPDNLATEILTTWAQQSRAAITKTAIMAIGDSMVALDTAAMEDIVRPEYRRKL